MKSNLSSLLPFEEDTSTSSSSSDFSPEYSHIKLYDNIIEEEEDSNIILPII